MIQIVSEKYGMMQENVFRFAIQIKAGRTVLGWSQTELAKRAGIARPTVARIESFTMQPKLETAEKIKDALRNAGIEFSDHQPERGFTMIVKSAALQSQRDEISRQEIEVTKKVIEQFSGLINKG
jgi:transcriptional regulator with XRE-family HTH domain